MDPSDVTQGNSLSALVELCTRFGAAGDIDCRVLLGESHLRFPPEVNAVLYQAVRELLVNVRQHARASRVQVATTTSRDGTIRLTVTDNGVGLSRHWREATPFAAGSGIGLWSVDQRLRAFGGYLDVESSAGGTRASLVLPGHLLKPENA
jgi:signal transduction histidine kinase